jgi:hypothetical protein
MVSLAPTKPAVAVIHKRVSPCGSAFPLSGCGQGTLAKLDSKNPVLYIDFPSGRLKLVGTLLFPKTKYQLLMLGGKDVLCEDIFESVVGTSIEHNMQLFVACGRDLLDLT